MKNLILLYLLFSSTLFAIEDDAYFKRWVDTKYESKTRRSMMYSLRGTGRMFERIFGGKTSQRIQNTFWAYKQKDSESCPLHSDGIANVGKLIGEVASDTVAIAKGFDHSRFRQTRRIKVCEHSMIKFSGLKERYNYDKFEMEYYYERPKTGKDIGMALITPMAHILLKIDDSYAYDWGGPLSSKWHKKIKGYHDALICVPTIMKKNISDSQILERLKCVSNLVVLSSSDYKYFKYNCGGFVSDVTHIAGLGIPGISNFGVGAAFRTKNKSVKEILTYVEKQCDKHLNYLRAVMEVLGRGNYILNAEITERIKDILQLPSHDLLMQFVSLAAKNKNLRPFLLDFKMAHPKHADQVADMVYRQAVGRGIFPADRARKNVFKEIFNGIPKEGRAWILRYFPTVFKLMKKYNV